MLISRRAAVGSLVGLALTLTATACGDDGPTSVTTAAAPTSDATATTAAVPAGDLTVFAAASLTESFTKIGDAFMAANPGVKVTFNFGASSTLAQQIDEGAPADVFASADPGNMRKVSDPGLTGADPVVFATNRLTIITPKGNPKGITGVADLAKPDVVVAICGPEVPIGKYAAQVFEKAGITVTPKSLEENVKAVVTKATLGEIDAGIVYATDVKAAGGKAEGVAIPDDLNVIATFPIAPLKASVHGASAAAFVAYVTSSAGQAVLADAGFLAP